MIIARIFTDGSTSNNQKRAISRSGIGVIIIAYDIITDLFCTIEFGEFLGIALTNQISEIQAAIKGINLFLDLVHTNPSEIYQCTILTDSTYVVETMKGNWKRNANQGYWLSLDNIVKLINQDNPIVWKHLREEKDNGHRIIDSVDALAKKGTKEQPSNKLSEWMRKEELDSIYQEAWII